MHDRKDPLDWDLNGSSQSSGGDFPRLNFSRQHSQGAPQQQAPPPPPPQFNRQLSNDIFGHVPNGNTRHIYSKLIFTGFGSRNRFLIKKPALGQETSFRSRNRFLFEKPVFDEETSFCSWNRFPDKKPVFIHYFLGLENGHRYGRRKIQKSEDELDFDPSQFALEQIRIDGLSRGLDDLSMSNNNRQMAPQKQR